VASTPLRFDFVTQPMVEKRLREFGGDDHVRDATLKRQFAEAGCDGQHLLEQPVKGSKLPNVVCTLPGNSEKVVIVGAHYDHVKDGDGVVDNWSGASLLPSLFQALKSKPRTHTFIFIGFTDEEKGEVGSYFYAHHMTKEEVQATQAMVNMDTLGLGPSEVWLSHSDKHLADMLVTVANALKLPISAVNVEQVGSTDSEQFAQKKIPRITIHSLTQDTWNARILHTKKDTIAEVRVDDHYQTYRLVAAYLVALDSWLSAAPRS
jgi:Zn-dependent M28 family amino/carboxypeptidase